MKTLHVIVRDKIATYRNRDGVIVCGNNNYYKISFKFDSEWDIQPRKVARFIWDGQYCDRELVNDECLIPVISNATEVTVGVYAGNLWTTTPAYIPCKKSILCEAPVLSDGLVEEYRDQAQKAAEEAKLAASSVIHPTIDVADIEGGHRLTIHDADGEKHFDVMDGEEGTVTPEMYELLEEARTAAEEAKAAAESITPISVEVEETTDGYKLTINDDTIEIKNGTGGLSASQLEDFTNMVKWYKEQTYKAMTGTFTATPSAGLYEMRKEEDFFDVEFKYSFSKEPRKVTFNDNGVIESLSLPEKDEKVTKTVKVGSATATKLTYKLYGEYYDTDLKKTDKVDKSLTFEFCNRIYYGYKPQPGKVDGTFVKSLDGVKEGDVNGKLATSRSISFKSTCPDDSYIWCAYPTRLGKAEVKMGTQPGGFEDPQSVPVTNQYGVTETYYVYRTMYKGFKDDYIHVT